MVVGARIATEVPLFLSAVQCSQIFKCQPTSRYFLTSLFKRDNFDGEVFFKSLLLKMAAI